MADSVRIVVGIDFGTTYSAICWADTQDPDHPELIHNYPTTGALVGSQVPSEIAYKDGDTTEFSWGYDISPQSRKVKWFKLGLEAGHSVMQLPQGLEAQDVVRDYLSRLYSHAISTLYRRFGKSVMDITKVDFVLTVPAVWTEKAKQKTEEAARSAGFGNEHGLQLLSEPEAAAIYTFKHGNTIQTQIKVGDRIVVCDCGGGTVDLISYDILQSYPVLSVKECAAGTGDYCGSTFIDRNFEQLFAKRMGKHYNELSIVNKQQVVKNFESTKKAFRDEPDRKFYVNVPTIADLVEAGIVGGNFELTKDDMRSLFDPIIEKVIDLVKDQVITVSKGTDRVNSILLVGGFGESEYLLKRIDAWAKEYGITVIQPREAATAIVRGAVLKGLAVNDTSTLPSVVRRARKSYGVPSNQIFIPVKHLEADAYIDKHTGQKMAGGQISWFIRKNQEINDEDVFKYAFYRQFRKLAPWQDSLVSCDSETPPSRFEPTLVKKLCTITTDLSHIRRSKFKLRWRKFKPYRSARYQLVMSLQHGNMTFHLEFMDQRYGVAQVEFD